MNPSISNNINSIQKINNIKQYNSLIEKNENIFFNKFKNKKFIKDEEISDLINKMNYNHNKNTY